MPLRNSQQAYGAVARSAHWATALFVLLAWLLGQFRDVFPRGAAREAALFAHMSLGLAIILLIVLRLAWRALDPPPPAIVGKRFEPWLGLAAKAGHLLLYALLIAAPILGVVMQFARGQALPVFGLFDIPSPWTMDRAFFRADARAARARRQRARHRRGRPRRSGAVPPLGAARPHAGAHAARAGLTQ